MFIYVFSTITLLIAGFSLSMKNITEYTLGTQMSYQFICFDCWTEKIRLFGKNRFFQWSFNEKKNIVFL